MKKRLFKLASLIMASTLVVAACSPAVTTTTTAGTTTGTTTGTVETTKPGEKVVLKFFHRWPNEPKKSYFDRKVAEFTALHPNVEIKVESVLNDSYKEKIRVQVANSAMPDVFFSWSDSFAENLVFSGKVRVLDDLYEQDKAWSDNIIASQTKGFTFDGKKYAVPLTMDGKAFFYNTEVFSKLNLEKPTTWKELLNVLDTLKENNYKTPIVAGLSQTWVVSHFMGPIFDRLIKPEVLKKDYNQKTGEFTDPGYVEGLNMFKTLTTYMGDISVAIDHETSRNMFINSEVPVIYLQLAEIRYLLDNKDLKFDYFNFPEVEGAVGEQKTLEGAPEGIMLSKDAPPEAIEFLKFLTSPTAAADYTKTAGDITAIKGGVTLESATEAQVKAFDLINSAESMTPWFDNAVNINIGDIFMKGGQGLATDQMTADEIMKDVQTKAKELRGN